MYEHNCKVGGEGKHIYNSFAWERLAGEGDYLWLVPKPIFCVYIRNTNIHNTHTHTHTQTHTHTNTHTQIRHHSVTKWVGMYTRLQYSKASNY